MWYHGIWFSGYLSVQAVSCPQLNHAPLALSTFPICLSLSVCKNLNQWTYNIIQPINQLHISLCLSTLEREQNKSFWVSWTLQLEACVAAMQPRRTAQHCVPCWRSYCNRCVKKINSHQHKITAIAIVIQLVRFPRAILWLHRTHTTAERSLIRISSHVNNPQMQCANPLVHPGQS